MQEGGGITWVGARRLAHMNIVLAILLEKGHCDEVDGLALVGHDQGEVDG